MKQLLTIVFIGLVCWGCNSLTTVTNNQITQKPIEDENKEIKSKPEELKDGYGRVTDVAGKTYNTIKIGEQVWMAENLAFKPSIGNYWAYDDDISNVPKYGYLYDWETAKNVCPTGWHLPSDDEWKELEIFLGMSQEETNYDRARGSDEGGKMKEVGLDHWNSPNKGATNSSGFNGLPGGYRLSNRYDYIGNVGFWWTATMNPNITPMVWFRTLTYNTSFINRGAWGGAQGISVRCVQD